MWVCLVVCMQCTNESMLPQAAVKHPVDAVGEGVPSLLVTFDLLPRTLAE